MVLIYGVVDAAVVVVVVVMHLLSVFVVVVMSLLSVVDVLYDTVNQKKHAYYVHIRLRLLVFLWYMLQ